MIFYFLYGVVAVLLAETVALIVATSRLKQDLQLQQMDGG